MSLAVRLASSQRWAALDRELEIWQSSKLVAKMWWRDDDATKRTPALDRLLDVSSRFCIPVALSVIPAHLEQTLPLRVLGCDRVRILQHGWDHTNHSQQGPKSELSVTRSREEVNRELLQGRTILQQSFADQFLLVLVPPFLQIADHLIPLVQSAFSYLSLYSDFPDVGMKTINVHCGLLNYRSQHPVTVTEASIVPPLLTALKLRRHNIVSHQLPIGIVTHHIDHTEDTWILLETIFARLRRHECVCFPSLDEIFCEGTWN